MAAVDVTGNLNNNGASFDINGASFGLTGRGFRGAGCALWNNTVAGTSNYLITTNIVSHVHSMKAEGIAGTPRLGLNPDAGPIIGLGNTSGSYANGSQGRGAPGDAAGGGMMLLFPATTAAALLLDRSLLCQPVACWVHFP